MEAGGGGVEEDDSKEKSTGEEERIGPAKEEIDWAEEMHRERCTHEKQHLG